jgi:hypothetical protein
MAMKGENFNRPERIASIKSKVSECINDVLMTKMYANCGINAKEIIHQLDI